MKTILVTITTADPAVYILSGTLPAEAKNIVIVRKYTRQKETHTVVFSFFLKITVNSVILSILFFRVLTEECIL